MRNLFAAIVALFSRPAQVIEVEQPARVWRHPLTGLAVKEYCLMTTWSPWLDLVIVNEGDLIIEVTAEDQDGNVLAKGCLQPWGEQLSFPGEDVTTLHLRWSAEAMSVRLLPTGGLDLRPTLLVWHETIELVLEGIPVDEFEVTEADLA